MRLKCVAGGEVEKRWGKGGGGSWSNLSAGYSSEKKQSKKDERISFFSPNIALTFFPLFHKNA